MTLSIEVPHVEGASVEEVEQTFAEDIKHRFPSETTVEVSACSCVEEES